MITLVLVFVLAALFIPTSLTYAQNHTLDDWLNAKKYYLTYIDINTACNEKGFDSDTIAEACKKVMIEYGKVMDSLFQSNSKEIDTILFFNP